MRDVLRNAKGLVDNVLLCPRRVKRRYCRANRAEDEVFVARHCSGSGEGSVGYRRTAHFRRSRTITATACGGAWLCRTRPRGRKLSVDGATGQVSLPWRATARWWHSTALSFVVTRHKFFPNSSAPREEGTTDDTREPQKKRCTDRMSRALRKEDPTPGRSCSLLRRGASSGSSLLMNFPRSATTAAPSRVVSAARMPGTSCASVRMRRQRFLLFSRALLALLLCLACVSFVSPPSWRASTSHWPRWVAGKAAPPSFSTPEGESGFVSADVHQSSGSASPVSPRSSMSAGRTATPPARGRSVSERVDADGRGTFSEADELKWSTTPGLLRRGARDRKVPAVRWQPSTPSSVPSEDRSAGPQDDRVRGAGGWIQTSEQRATTDSFVETAACGSGIYATERGLLFSSWDLSVGDSINCWSLCRFLEDL